eukprot:4695487-Pleurochrysis_carterae.AAC.4
MRYAMRDLHALHRLCTRLKVILSTSEHQLLRRLLGTCVKKAFCPRLRGFKLYRRLRSAVTGKPTGQLGGAAIIVRVLVCWMRKSNLPVAFTVIKVVKFWRIKCSASQIEIAVSKRRARLLRCFRSHLPSE